MSDDDFESSTASSEEDFSASEDEWLPGKDRKKTADTATNESENEDDDEDDDDEDVENEDDDDDDDDDDEEEEDLARKTSRKRPAPKSSAKGQKKPQQQPSKKAKRLSSGKRDELYKHYKKELLKNPEPARTPVNANVADILQKCEFRKKRTVHDEQEDGSASSGDDYLVDPEQLDLGSTFFRKEPPKAATTVPTFDVNAGMRLSDSSDSEADENGALPSSIPKQAVDGLISRINEKSSEYMNFTNLDQFTAKLEEAKRFLKNYQSKPAAGGADAEQQEDVSNLLAQGEMDGDISPGKAASNVGSDSDWEEVQEGATVKQESQQPDWQLTVQVETAKSRRQRREELEMELCIKRQINKVKRANQLSYHKASVVCAIAIGKRLNEIANSSRIRGLALSMMQDKACFPVGSKPDGKFVEQLAEWFQGKFSLESMEMDSGHGKSCDFGFTLGLELFTRKISCKRNYILLFLVFLRLAGMQVRLVNSACVPGKRPAMSDLCPISERQLKESFEKQSTAVGDEESRTEDVKPAIKIQIQRTTPTPSPNIKAPSVSPVAKENSETAAPAPRRHSPRVAAPALIKEERKTGGRRKALTTLNIPQLDGVDDIGSPVEPISRRLRRSRAVAAESPESPFAKRKTNTPVRQLQDNNNNNNQRKLKVAKRKLFNKDEPVVEPPPTVTTTRRGGRVKPEPKSVEAPPQAVSRKPPVGGKRRVTSPKVPAVEDKKQKVESDDQPPQSQPSPPISAKKINRKVLSSSEEDGEDDRNGATSKPPSRRRKTSATKGKKKTKAESEEDSDFELPAPKSAAARQKKAATGKKSISPRVATQRKSKGGGEMATSGKVDTWIEFYCEKTSRWITFDLFAMRSDCVDSLVRNAPNPLSYVFGWDNEGHAKDVTARYVQNWNTACRMLRVDQKWLDATLAPVLGKKTKRDRNEDNELNKFNADKPMPKTITEYKNHPLYVLKRHLLKFQALYPVEPPTLGFIRGEAVYPRDCVHILQTREKWHKQGRTVRAFEVAYKVVKCWRYDKPTNTWLGNQPCDIFGHWQTDEYEPPTAENGVVPRNEYGNVELFTEKMLPKGTVHLKLPGLNRVCRRLGIDCASVITGFEMAKMRMIPVYDGFAVCKEFAERAIEEWYKDMEQEEQREQEKLEKRVYGNWKRLIKGLFVRRKLQNKYNFDNLA